MGDSIEKIKNQFNEYFQTLNNKQKIKIGLGSFFLILSLSLAIIYITKPEYVPVYTGLSFEEAGAITSKLDEMSIPWKDSNGGTSILVPEDYVNKARMNLAIEGFPDKGITWEDAFNDSSLTMTNEERKMKYLRAETNSLARTIEEISGVKSARVHLTIPDNSNFLNSENNYSKASVFVSLNPGFKLSQQQVNGIVMLIANAVEGLQPDNISIHDDTGSVLNNSPRDNDSFTVNSQMDLQREMKTRLEDSIKKLLSRIYGSQNVDVMVNIDLDFDQEVTNITEFSTPQEDESTGLIRSISELREQVVNDGEGGPPGTDSNSNDITEYNELDNNSSSYEKENRNVNYELNEIRKNIVKAPGQVDNITVAVILNTNSLVDGELTDDHRQELVNLVSASAGLETRLVEVMAREFNDPSSDQLLSISSEQGSFLGDNLSRYGIGILSLLLIIGAIFAFYRIRKRKQEVSDIFQTAATEDVSDVEEIDLDFADKSSYKHQIEKFVEKKPEAVAQLLRSWLNED